MQTIGSSAYLDDQQEDWAPRANINTLKRNKAHHRGINQLICDRSDVIEENNNRYDSNPLVSILSTNLAYSTMSIMQKYVE